MDIIKSKVHEHLKQRLEETINELKSAIDKVQESIVGEEKSTAGDKYETARAMGHNELNQLNRQLAIALKSYQELERLGPAKPTNKAQMGALVRTKGRVLYLSVGFGKFAVGGNDVFAVSLGSPIAQTMLGKHVGDVVKVGNKEEVILDIQ